MGYLKPGYVQCRTCHGSGAMINPNAQTCPHCEGKGDIYMHDPSGDGHGGLNGGSWGHFPCSMCKGTGKVDKYDIERYEERKRGW